MSRNLPGTFGDRLDVSATGNVNITGGSLTLAAWIMHESHTASAPILAKWHFADPNGCQYLLWSSAGKPAFNIGDGIGGNQGPLGATTVADNVWRHFAGVLSGGVATVYLDGVADATTAVSINIGNTGGPVMRIGLDSPGSAFFLDARVAEAAIWNAGLTAAEILSLAKGVSPGMVRRNSLRNYWPLNGLNSSEADLAGIASPQPATVSGTVPAANHSPVGPYVSMAA